MSLKTLCCFYSFTRYFYQFQILTLHYTIPSLFTNKEYLISLRTNNKYMKTYLLDILNKYNRFSENLDVKTILCNKSWLVFNDTGNKELYIFQENGNLIASINGNVHNGNWQYISANKSIILSFKEQSYMLHPSFFDKTIFALQQDGTNKYAFMIDEKQSQSFQPKSLTELKSYFEKINSQRIEKQEYAKQISIKRQEEYKQSQLRHEQELKIQSLKQEATDAWERNHIRILNNDMKYRQICKNEVKNKIITFGIGFIITCLYVWNGTEEFWMFLVLLIPFGILGTLIIGGILLAIFSSSNSKKLSYENMKKEEYISNYIKKK